MILILTFTIHCYSVYIRGGAWIPYVVVDVLSFLSIPLIFISKKSLCYRLISRVSDWIYAKVYSFIISEA